MKKKLYNVFDDVLLNGGIFKALSLLDVPWRNDTDDTALDLEYFGNISGQKTISPLIDRLLGTNTTLTNENITTLASVIYNMFGRNWTELYATLSYEYDPISNYDMTETESSSGTTSDTLTHTGTQSTTHTGTQNTTHTGTQTATHTGTVQNSDNQIVNGSGNGTTSDNVYGFNSADAVGDTTSENTTTNENTAQGSSTQTNNLTDGRTDNLTDERTDNLTDGRTDNLMDTGSGSHTDTRTLTRSGNIGITTSQMMIQSQRDLWLWNFFYTVVFPDVDKVLTLSTYSKC